MRFIVTDNKRAGDWGAVYISLYIEFKTSIFLILHNGVLRR